VDGSLADVIGRISADYELPIDDDHVEGEAIITAEEIERRLEVLGTSIKIERIEIAKPVFYRGEYAYLVGRIVRGEHLVPLILSIRHSDGQVVIDAVLMEENDVSLLFSFARSYFHVEVQRPYELVRFIKSIIPNKPTAEIYISIGCNKHGKTELYRHALRHLASSTDKYELAKGQRGMVMMVFTMPSYPVVFKIIKDHFDYPKNTTRQAVIDRYRLVFKHDRAGRLIDAQEYQYLELDRHRFDDELIAELLEVAAESVSVGDDRVVIKHCYAERRVTPLDIFLREADEEEAQAAVIDYGQAIKDLAITNIFPGDLLLKNFGVTRQHRVIFYDYDEICLLTDCNVRKLPQSDDYDDEMAAEPWFSVDENDMFPEEFRHFLGLAPPLREVFLEYHADLLTVDYWVGVQQQLKADKIIHVAPYGDDKRVRRETTSAKSLVRAAS
jgi:isocitrate dehydrogenase kinase/phosphatase